MFRYYDAYLSYFSEYLRDHTPNETFERFIFSSAYNFDPDLEANDVNEIKIAAEKGKKHPEMLNRLLAGLLHPLIHLAYGLEFGLPGQAAEGWPNFVPEIYDPIIKDVRLCTRRRKQSGTDQAGATSILRQTYRTQHPRQSDV